MPFLDASVLGGIALYQRWLSPHKGFRCAHAAVFGGESCSAAVARTIRERGLWGSGTAIAARFAACRQAYSQLCAGTTSGPRVRGVCCCGPLPIPFRCG